MSESINTNTNTNTNTTNNTSIIIEKEEPFIVLGDHIFVELNILSGKTNSKDIERYNQTLLEYQKAVQRAEDLAMNFDGEEPEKPNFQIDYRPQWVNLGHKIIHSWCDDWDEEKECAVIIAEMSNIGSDDISQYNICMVKSEWISILESLGACHIKTKVKTKK